MAYRNGTYIAFHANGTNRVGESDLKYYQLIRGWSATPNDNFSCNDSHEKTYQVRDTSSKETLKKRLLERLSKSKNMLLIIGKTTKYDTDWVPIEIEKAIDHYNIPLIITYTGYDYILNPSLLRDLWPDSLKKRIDNSSADAIHIPFKKTAILTAINQFDLNNRVGLALQYYNKETQRDWGYIK